MKKASLGGIIRHRSGGIGFKSTFSTEEEAQKYKDMWFWIMKDDGYKVEITKGYYDRKEEKTGGK